MSIASRYYRLCRISGVEITPMAAIMWSRQTTFGVVGFFEADAAVALGIGTVTPCRKYVWRM